MVAAFRTVELVSNKRIARPARRQNVNCIQEFLSSSLGLERDAFQHSQNSIQVSISSQVTCQGSNHRPPITDHRQSTTDLRPPTTDNRPLTADGRPPLRAP